MIRGTGGPVIVSIYRRMLVAVVAALSAVAPLSSFTAASPAAAAHTPGLIPVGEFHHTYTSFWGAGTTSAFSTPAVGDVTGDGVPEIVTGGMDGCVRVTTLQARLLRGCLFTGGGAVQGSPVLVDWNRDGVLDIIASSTGGGIHGWRGNGAALLSIPTQGPVFSTPAVGDIDGDGLPDIAIATWGSFVTVFRHDGSTLFSHFIYDTSWSSPALADLDGDGRLEVIVGADMDIGNGANLPPYNLAPGGFVWVFHADGRVANGFPRHLSDQVIWSSPSVVDLNGDGKLDIVVGTGENWLGKGRELFAIDRNGNSLPGWPVAMPGPTMGSPAIADLDGDGQLEVVEQSGDGSISFISANGGVRKRWCNRSANQACFPVSLDGQPSIGDIDGDGVQDVVTVTEADLRVFNGASGALEYTNALPFWWSPGSQPTIVSYGGDTYVVVVRTERTAQSDPAGTRGVGDEQAIRVFRSGHAAGALAWPTFRNNMLRTGTFHDSVPPTVSGSFTVASPGFTKLWIDHSGMDVDTGIGGFDVEVRQDALAWARAVSRGGPRGVPGASVANRRVVFALPGHSYTARVRSWDQAGNRSAWSALGTIAVGSTVTRSQPFRSAYAGSVNGAVSAISSPPVNGPALPGGLGRGVAASPRGGGYALDGWGGIHPFGGAPALAGTSYWPGWDIGRGIALDPAGGGGLVLDGFGGLHPFGTTRAPRGGPYFPGVDIARGVVMRADSTPSRPKGYVLDGYGGVHPFGGAPAVRGTAYWAGWDIARGFALDPAGVGGYVLDAFGGLHPFGGAPRRSIGQYWSGRDVARGVALIGGGAPGRGYVLDATGAIWRFGAAPGVQVTTRWAARVARGLAIAP